jgi:GntR family transcriptional regulator, phosphonate transport system regulatory protein
MTAWISHRGRYFFSPSEDVDTSHWPLWLKAEHTILRAIRAGKFKPGEQLPGEHQLAEALGIHRHTVRRAIESLGGQGLLEIRRGRGTTCNPSPLTRGPRQRCTAKMP